MAHKFEVFTPDLYVSSSNPNLLTLVNRLNNFFEANLSYKLVELHDASVYGPRGTVLVSYETTGRAEHDHYVFSIVNVDRYFDGNFNTRNVADRLNNLIGSNKYIGAMLLEVAVPVVLLVTAVNTPPVVYNITYNLDGGTNSGANPSTFTESTPLITLADPTKVGFEFLGWFDAAEDGSKVTEINPAIVAANVTLYARWTSVE